MKREKNSSEQSDTNFKIAVGSLNPIKIKAVKNVFSKVYSQSKIEVIKVPSTLKIPPQPIGMEIIKGAKLRAEKAIKKTNSKFGVGIEAGLIKFPQTLTGYLEIEWCAIIDKTGKITVGCSPGFELPPDFVAKMLKGEGDLEKLMSALSGIKKLGEKFGTVGLLSKGFLNRLKLTEQAVLMALIPRLNWEKYFPK